MRTSKASLVLGALWGDEAKGKITDLLAAQSDWVIRFSGGNNAGHSLHTPQGHFKLQLIPSGILNPNSINLIAAGCVVDPQALLGEIDGLTKVGISTLGLKIDLDCHLVLPFHREIDRRDEASKGAEKIGTTLRGIGPAQADKYRRIGIRFRDVLESGFDPKWERLYSFNRSLIDSFYSAHGATPEWTSASLLSDLKAQVQRLRPHLIEGRRELELARVSGKSLLLEGAQGAFLDLMAGDYPFVTSSHPGLAGALIGTGLGPSAFGRVIGVVKAYSTRVGNGPFPSEITGPLATHIRERGREFGTVTGRERRIGWLDLALLRRSIAMNGITEIALTLLDVLSGVSEIRVRDADPSGHESWTKLQGWTEELSKIRSRAALPLQARDYLSFIEEKLNTPIRIISVGPHREETILQ
ncbi:MAG: adenylosuccinate synthase [Oligoflexia bacterium]